jgi:formate/nitrite transporter FocA (FNT family)
VKNLKRILQSFLLAMASGVCIGMGGSVYLLQENRMVGALFFTVGLFTILWFGFSLYTGMVGYLTDRLTEKKPCYLLELLLVWLGNFAGTVSVAFLLCLTRMGEELSRSANALVITKLHDTWYSLLILGIFCGMLMFIAVDTYKKTVGTTPLLACIAVVIGVAVFILAGFEHSIADMFYAAVADRIGEMLVPILIITVGNAVGANLIPVIMKLTVRSRT